MDYTVFSIIPVPAFSLSHVPDHRRAISSLSFYDLCFCCDSQCDRANLLCFASDSYFYCDCVLVSCSLRIGAERRVAALVV